VARSAAGRRRRPPTAVGAIDFGAIEPSARSGSDELPTINLCHSSVKYGSNSHSSASFDPFPLRLGRAAGEPDLRGRNGASRIGSKADVALETGKADFAFEPGKTDSVLKIGKADFAFETGRMPKQRVEAVGGMGRGGRGGGAHQAEGGGGEGVPARRGRGAGVGGGLLDEEEGADREGAQQGRENHLSPPPPPTQPHHHSPQASHEIPRQSSTPCTRARKPGNPTPRCKSGVNQV
jgi:hypothetical protein